MSTVKGYIVCRLCDKIDPTNELDLAGFFSNTAGNFEGVVQYNKDNREFEVCSIQHLALMCCKVYISYLSPL